MCCCCLAYLHHLNVGSHIVHTRIIPSHGRLNCRKSSLEICYKASGTYTEQLAYEMLCEREYVLPSHELHQSSKASPCLSKNSLVPAVGDPSLAPFAIILTRLNHLGQWRQSCLTSHALESCPGTLRHWLHLHGNS